MVASIETPIAVGELIDKITILEIKVARFTDAAKIANARTELTLLCARRDAALPRDAAISALSERLKSVNERIWDLEDLIRDCERKKDFGEAFVTVARSIYRTNDERAAIKREINAALGSTIIEEKSYADY